MITNKNLKEYDLKTINEYFNLITESYLNGQIKQMTEQYKRLGKNQRQSFIDWLNYPEINSQDVREGVKNYLLKNL